MLTTEEISFFVFSISIFKIQRKIQRNKEILLKITRKKLPNVIREKQSFSGLISAFLLAGCFFIIEEGVSISIIFGIFLSENFISIIYIFINLASITSKVLIYVFVMSFIIGFSNKMKEGARFPLIYLYCPSKGVVVFSEKTGSPKKNKLKEMVSQTVD